MISSDRNIFTSNSMILNDVIPRLREELIEISIRRNSLSVLVTDQTKCVSCNINIFYLFIYLIIIIIYIYIYIYIFFFIFFRWKRD